MNIPQAIMHLFPQAVPMSDFVVQDDSDGKGAYIAQWNLKDASGNPITQPTVPQLQTAWNSYIANPPSPRPTSEQRLAALESSMITLMGL